MNTFNDNAYDKACDELEELRAKLADSERIIGSLRQQLATVHTERDVLRQRLEVAEFIGRMIIDVKDAG